MAYADWDITGTESAVVNSSLSNPLPVGVAGSFCRQLGSVGNSCRMFLKASYESGAFVGVPVTKMIRAQAYLRRNPLNTNDWYGGMYVKCIDATTPTGYGLVLRRLQSGTSFQLIVNNTTQYSINIPGAEVDQWTGLRMDVFPIGTANDRIVVSKETTPGSGVWNPVSINGGVAADGILINSNSPEYAPWGGSRRCGLVGGAYGQAFNALYADKVYFAVSDAP